MSVDYDVIIIGAGISGLYQLHRLRGFGLSVCVLEAGEGLGGTWYWNRYPGARFDSESYSYGYSFSQEILDEWQWSEHFAAQLELTRFRGYLTLTEGGIHHAPISLPLPAGVPPAADRSGPSWTDT